MLKRISNLKNVSVYTVTEVINKGIPFLLLPILTVYLSPSEYGILALFNVLLGFTRAFVGLSSNGAVLRKYYDKETTNFPIFLANISYILLFSAIVVIIVYSLGHSLLTKYLKFTYIYTIYAILISCFEFIIFMYLVLLQVKHASYKYGVFKNMFTLLQVLLVLLFITVFNLNWVGKVYGQLVASLVFSLIVIIILIRNKKIKFKFNKNYFLYGIRFGAPLIPHQVSKYTINVIDKVFITSLVNIGATGIYSVGNQLSSAVDVLLMAINTAWTPTLYEKLKLNKLKTNIQIVKITYVLLLVSVLVPVFYYFTMKLIIPFIVGNKFESSIEYVLLISAGFGFRGMSVFLSNFLFYFEKTKLVALTTVPTAFINIILSYTLINIYGAYGAAISLFITFGFQFLLTVVIVFKNVQMPWALQRSDIIINHHYNS